MEAYSRTKEYRQIYKKEYNGPKQNIALNHWKKEYYAQTEELNAHNHTIFAHEGDEGGIL